MDDNLYLSCVTEILTNEYDITVIPINYSQQLLLSASSSASSSHQDTNIIISNIQEHQINTYYTAQQFMLDKKFATGHEIVKHHPSVSDTTTNIVPLRIYSSDCLQNLKAQIYLYQQIIIRNTRVCIVSSKESTLFTTQLVSEDILSDAMSGLIQGGIFTNHFRPIFIEVPTNYQCLYKQYQIYSEELKKPGRKFEFYEQLASVTENLQHVIAKIEYKSKQSKNKDNDECKQEKIQLLFLTPSQNVASLSVLNNLQSVSIQEPSVFSFAATWYYNEQTDRFNMINTKITHMENNYTTQCYLQYLSSCVQKDCSHLFQHHVNNHHNNTILMNLSKD